MNKLRFFTNFFSSWATNTPKLIKSKAKHRSRERAHWSTYIGLMWEGYNSTRHSLSYSAGIAASIIVAELQRERRGFARQSMVGAMA